MKTTISYTEKMAQLLSEKLQSRGIEGNYSHSGNDYGESYYFVFWNKKCSKLKIRISDHSVMNMVRMQIEECVYELNNEQAEQLAEKVKYFLYPEKIKEKPRLTVFHLLSDYSDITLDEAKKYSVADAVKELKKYGLKFK